MVYHRLMISAGSPPRISSNTLTPIHLHLVEAGVRSRWCPNNNCTWSLPYSPNLLHRIWKSRESIKKVAEVANIKNLTGSIRKLIYWAHFHHFLFPQISIHFQYLNLLSLSALLNCRAIFLCFLQDLQWSAADRWHPDFEMAPMCGNRNCA